MKILSVITHRHVVPTP